MDEQVARVISSISDFAALSQFEANARRRDALTEEVASAIKARWSALGRALIAERAGLDLSELTPAEERIVEAISEYVGVMKRKGKDAPRTFQQLRNRGGLIAAAEAAVCKSKPTQGFQTLKDAELHELSYERIILDHKDEFTPRARWYASRALGEPTEGDHPPARRELQVQVRTEALLDWLKARALKLEGKLGEFRNEDAAKAVGILDLRTHGRVFGNVQSRLDFACYRLNLPPLGLAAKEPFKEAWADASGRVWSYPVATMAEAAKAFVWHEREFDNLKEETRSLSGNAGTLWKSETGKKGQNVFAWATGLTAPLSNPASGSSDFSDAVNREEDEGRTSPGPSEESGQASHDSPEKETLFLLPELIAQLAALESKYSNASPEERSRVSRSIERGPIGAALKKANGHACQICFALGMEPHGFLKPNGEPYVEAHHVMPVSSKRTGSLSPSNIITVCANHHRQLHYGHGVHVRIQSDHFCITISGKDLRIPRVFLGKTG